jgi:hypothetical protein
MALPTQTEIYGGYATGAQIIVQAAQTEVIAQLTKLKNLIPNPDAGVATTASPGSGLDQIPPHAAWQLRAEIDDLIVKIDAFAVA